jgi:hypothetical protein
MATPPVPAEKVALVCRAFEDAGGNISSAARALGLPRPTVQRILRKAGQLDKPLAGGRLPGRPLVHPRPTTGVRRYLLTSAQNNTRVNEVVLRNLRAYQAHHRIPDENFLCASYSYNQNAYGQLAVKRGRARERQRDLWFDPALGGSRKATEALLSRSDRAIELAPGLVWCGNMNTLPTAQRPLSGFENYTGRASGIFPHAQLALESISSPAGEPTKMNYTTGTVTLPNYIQKREGLRAERTHSAGGLVVEVTSRGWFVRQLQADARGTIYDWDLKIEDGVVTTGHRVEAITWGDVHVPEMRPAIRALGWDPGGMLDQLQPHHQYIHDLTSFRGRNYHDVRDCHRRYQSFLWGEEEVEAEMRACAAFLTHAGREWCETHVVRSNHDELLDRWLREADYREDPINAVFFLETQLAKYRAIKNGERAFLTLEHVLRGLGAPLSVEFLRLDQNSITCRAHRGGIENGCHGHMGPRGTRGSPAQYARMGRAVNIGHHHNATILGLVWVAGACPEPEDTTYARGPGNWSISHIITYPTGTRSIVTAWNGACRGE